jgi:hypothetical protein
MIIKKYELYIILIKINFNVKSKPFPIDGQLSFGFFLDSTTTSTVTVGNFQLSFHSTLKSVVYTAYTDNNKQYVNTIDVPYGFYAQSVTGTDTNPIQIGALYLSNDSIAIILRGTITHQKKCYF